MSYIPVNDPPPPDDFHTWARPASPPCPDCECCTASLCVRAIERDTACHWEGRGADFELANCPCWRQGSVARKRLTADPVSDQTIPSRCAAAHAEDSSPCDGPLDAVRVVDQTGAEVSGCVQHGAVLLASIQDGRVYPGSVEGAAIQAYEQAQQLGPFEFGGGETR